MTHTVGNPERICNKLEIRDKHVVHVDTLMHRQKTSTQK